MRAMLFDVNCSPIVGLMKPSDGDFTYLQGSTRPYMAKCRTILQEWFDPYPTEEHRRFLGRFRDGRRDEQHRSAVFELFLHEVLRRRGYGIEVEPTMPNGEPTHPDFKAYQDAHPRFYLEARHKLPPDVELSDRFPLVFESLDRVYSTDFHVSLDVDGRCATQPPHGKWRRAVEGWLSSLDPKAETGAYLAHGPKSCASLALTHEGLRITVRPIPKSPAHRGTPNERTVGCVLQGMKLVRTAEQLRSAVIDKATKYGEIDLPYIVAVDVASDFSIDQEDIFEALFGSLSYEVSLNDGEASRWIQHGNGVWSGPEGRNNGVSAALVWCGRIPGDLITRSPILVHNPWARRALDPDLWPLDQFVAVPGTPSLECRTGPSAADFLELEDFRGLA